MTRINPAPFKHATASEYYRQMFPDHWQRFGKCQFYWQLVQILHDVHPETRRSVASLRRRIINEDLKHWTALLKREELATAHELRRYGELTEYSAARIECLREIITTLVEGRIVLETIEEGTAYGRDTV